MEEFGSGNAEGGKERRWKRKKIRRWEGERVRRTGRRKWECGRRKKRR
jgi:hypothetical protein